MISRIQWVSISLTERKKCRLLARLNKFFNSYFWAKLTTISVGGIQTTVTFQAMVSLSIIAVMSPTGERMGH